MAEKKIKIGELPEEVAKNYELVNWVGGPRQHFGRYGDIDLDKMTEAQAQRLVQMGFPRIKKKEDQASNDSKTPAKKGTSSKS
jgi:hypothetical protein